MRRIGGWDTVALGAYAVLVAVGLMALRSVALAEGGRVEADMWVRQLRWLGVVGLTALGVRVLQPRNIEVLAYPLYAVGMFMLILPLVMGREVAGTRAWLHLGPVNIQPAELMKVFTALALAHYLTTPGMEWRRMRAWGVAALLVVLPMAVIFLQNDMGTLLTYAGLYLLLWRKGAPSFLPVTAVGLGGVFLLTLYFPVEYVLAAIAIGTVVAGGIGWFLGDRRILIPVALVAVAAALTAWGTQAAFDLLQPHQQERILVTIGKKEDPRGQGYNLQQSLIAVGSGGLWGKGYRQGSQTQYGFVPEQHTDFIFTVIAEEWGWVGSVAVVLLYALLMWRVITLAERSPSETVRLVGYGYVGVLLMHAAINIASVVGLFPVVGIPLPYISYGGSALLGFSMFLFVFLAMEAHTRESVHRL